MTKAQVIDLGLRRTSHGRDGGAFVARSPPDRSNPFLDRNFRTTKVEVNVELHPLAR